METMNLLSVVRIFTSKLDRIIQLLEGEDKKVETGPGCPPKTSSKWEWERLSFEVTSTGGTLIVDRLNVGPGWIYKTTSWKYGSTDWQITTTFVPFGEDTRPAGSGGKGYPA